MIRGTEDGFEGDVALKIDQVSGERRGI